MESQGMVWLINGLRIFSGRGDIIVTMIAIYIRTWIATLTVDKSRTLFQYDHRLYMYRKNIYLTVHSTCPMAKNVYFKCWDVLQNLVGHFEIMRLTYEFVA